MKCYESGVIGMFIGALVLCGFMAAFPKHTTCEVDYGDTHHTHVRIGVWNE